MRIRIISSEVFHAHAVQTGTVDDKLNTECKLGTELSASSALLPFTDMVLDLHTHNALPLSVKVFLWVLNKKTLNIQGEKSVFKVDDFFSDPGYALTENFMCSCAALYKSSYMLTDFVELTLH